VICVSLGAGDYETCRRILSRAPFAEIRLDRVRLTLEEVGKLFSLPRRLIATCRPGRFSDEKREKLLREAMRAGASYIDIELEAPAALRQRLVREGRRRGCKIIISYHNDRLTPGEAVLSQKVASCYNLGADIAKVACHVRSDSDVRRILSLYHLEKKRGASLLALGMGKRGTITRIAAPFLGAPFTFAAADPGQPTAPGQLDRKTMERFVRVIGGKGP